MAPKATPVSASQILDQEYLEIRAKILEVGASLDRLDRGDGDVSQDQRFARLREGISLLLEAEDGRAERVQKLFSLDYDAEWRTTLEYRRK